MNEESHNPPIDPQLAARIAAMVLGEASDFESDELAQLIDQQPELAALKRELQSVHGLLEAVGEGEWVAEDDEWKLPDQKRKLVLAAINGEPVPQAAAESSRLNLVLTQTRRRISRPWLRKLTKIAAAISAVGFFGLLVSFSLFVSPMRQSAMVYDATTAESLDHFTDGVEAESNESLSRSETRGWTADAPAAPGMAGFAPSESRQWQFEQSSQSALSGIRDSLSRNTSPEESSPPKPVYATGAEHDFLLTPDLYETGELSVSGELSAPEVMQFDFAESSAAKTPEPSGLGFEARPLIASAESIAGGRGSRSRAAQQDSRPNTSGASGGDLSFPKPSSGVERWGADAMSLSDPAIADSESAAENPAGSTESEQQVSPELYGRSAGGLGGGGLGGGGYGGGGYGEKQIQELDRDAKLSNQKGRKGVTAPPSVPSQPALEKEVAEGWMEPAAQPQERSTFDSGLVDSTPTPTNEPLPAIIDDVRKGVSPSRGAVVDVEKKKSGVVPRFGDDATPADVKADGGFYYVPQKPGQSEVTGLTFQAREFEDEPSVSADKDVSGQEIAKREESLGERLSERIVESASLFGEKRETAKPMTALAQKERKLGQVTSSRQLNRGETSIDLFGTELDRQSKQKADATAGFNEKSAVDEAFSTFSLHVSDVSFKLAKAALARGEWPEAAKVRIEEFVNAFDYGDPLPNKNEKVACRLEQAIHPFLQQRNVLRVSMRTAAAGRASSTPLRLTFLLDNSGSMERIDRRQTVRRAFALLAQQLTPIDQVTLISFARQPRLLADKVSRGQTAQLIEMINELPSQGGTNLEAALQLAFEKSREQYLSEAQNRVILLTDGAVNLGNANPESLSRMITTMRGAGIAFDAAGISADGLNDEILEALTRKGDGRYYLLDSLESADEGFARQIAGALRPSAKNVKVQIEFNPDRVGRYKLLGFEKHRLNKEDFRNDQVDAAEMTSAEAGVAIYQFEAMPDGEGDVGSVSVRFRDLSTGQMVENRWPIPYRADAPRLDRAAPTLRVAAVAGLLAAKLRGEPLGETVDLKTLAGLISGLPETLRNNTRVVELQTMIGQTRQLSGK